MILHAVYLLLAHSRELVECHSGQGQLYLVGKKVFQIFSQVTRFNGCCQAYNLLNFFYWFVNITFTPWLVCVSCFYESISLLIYFLFNNMFVWYWAIGSWIRSPKKCKQAKFIVWCFFINYSKFVEIYDMRSIVLGFIGSINILNDFVLQTITNMSPTGIKKLIGCWWGLTRKQSCVRNCTNVFCQKGVKVILAFVRLENLCVNGLIYTTSSKLICISQT